MKTTPTAAQLLTRRKLFCTGFYVVLIVSLVIAHGGVHSMYMDIPTITKVMKVDFSLWTLSLWSVTFTKISICLMLLRIKQTRIWTRFLWALIAAMVATAIAGCVVQLLQCTPISGNWNPFTHETACWSAKKVQISAGIYNGKLI
jgi:hypothetical protein